MGAVSGRELPVERPLRAAACVDGRCFRDHPFDGKEAAHAIQPGVSHAANRLILQQLDEPRERLRFTRR